MDDTVILIPVRLQATRFPNKPFAKIGNLPMLHYVYNSASNFFSNVYLAICDEPVEEYCNENNIQYVLTDPSHVSGSDRIGEAIKTLEKTAASNKASIIAPRILLVSILKVEVYV